MHPRKLIALAAAAIATAILAACGSAAGPGAAPAHSAKPLSCKQQYAQWKHGPARAAAKHLVAEVRGLQTVAQVANIPATRRAIIKLGPAAKAVQAYPMPKCADPAGYWPKYLALIRAGAENARVGRNSLTAVMLALVPLKALKPLQRKLSAELRQTAGVK